jgi:PAT family beta-lactamase induction signal transducer AmpG
MLAGLPYSFKFLWCPFVEHHRLPFVANLLGPRRSWLLLTQLLLMVTLFGIGQCDPLQHRGAMMGLVFLTALLSATQDIIIDAYRIEILTSSLRGAGAAVETIGFRLGMFVSGAGALYLGGCFGWQRAYEIMALCMLVGIATVLWMPEPTMTPASQMHKNSLSTYLSEFFKAQKRNPHVLKALLIFILFFKWSDTTLNAMSGPFLYELGFNEFEFANITKVFGIPVMIMGCILAGPMIHAWGIGQTLVLCAVFQAVSCLLFAGQAFMGHHAGSLMVVIGFESFCSGLTSAAFIAYLSSFCKPPYTALYFTLLYSLGSLGRVLVSAFSSWLADFISWPALFMLSSLALVPTLLALNYLMKSSQSSALTPDVTVLASLGR